MIKPRRIKIVIDQGGPRLNSAELVLKEKNLALVYLDMSSKRNQFVGTAIYNMGFSGGKQLKDNTPGIVLSGDPETLRQEPGKEGVKTVVWFPEFVGWRVELAESRRYTVSILLINERALRKAGY